MGGGPAGTACAVELARLGLEVLVAERGGYTAHRIGETLAPAGHRSLVALGAVGLLSSPPHRQAVALRSVWGEAGPREHNYLFEPYSRGWHLDRAAFDAGLAAIAAARGAHVARRLRIVGLTSLVDGWRLRLVAASGRQTGVRCRFIVDATGRAAVIARRLGGRTVAVDRLIADYGLLGSRPEVPEPVTMIEAIPDGWWYTAPLPDGRLITALLTDHQAGARARHDRWTAALASAPNTAARIPEDAVPTLRTVSARSTQTLPSSGDGWLAVGDAASARDPLAGDGIPRALTDGIAAAQAVGAALAGDPLAVGRLAQERDAAHARYLIARAETYALERRWADTPFWRCRDSEHRSLRPPSASAGAHSHDRHLVPR